MTRAFAWSLVLHVVAVLVAAMPLVRGALDAWQRAGQAAVSPVVAPEEVEVVVPEVVVVRPAPQPSQSFIRTDGLPEAKPEAGKSAFISDRDTRAASLLPADLSATVAQPTQDGVDIPVVEVIRRDQSDGDDEALPPASSPAAGAVAGAESPAEEVDPLRPEETQEPRPEVALRPPTPAVRPEEPAVEAASTDSPLLDRPTAPRMALAPDADVAVAVDPERTPPVRPPAPVPAPPAVAAALRDPDVDARPPSRPPEAPSGRPAASKPPSGFSGLRQPTKLRGTISNQGTASVDAENTPTGRYMKQVTSAVEREWHRKRRLNRDFVTFGTIKLEFHVDARGEVHDLTIKNRSGANAVMQDFTLNAVLDASIPPMPTGLPEILDRELLLISYDIIVY
jgi:hypothetical protein